MNGGGPAASREAMLRSTIDTDSSVKNRTIRYQSSILHQVVSLDRRVGKP
jgi:hypothetical protein